MLLFLPIFFRYLQVRDFIRKHSSDIKALNLNPTWIARHNLIQFKVIHRLHYSKLNHHKTYPTISPLCNKCKMLEGTLLYSLWSSSKIQPFWKCIFKFLSEVYSVDLEPELCIGHEGNEGFVSDKSHIFGLHL